MTQRAFQPKPLCDKHFHFKGFILQDVMSIYLNIMSSVVRRQLGECKNGDKICHCCWLIRGQTGTLCVCWIVSVRDRLVRRLAADKRGLPLSQHSFMPSSQPCQMWSLWVAFTGSKVCCVIDQTSVWTCMAPVAFSLHWKMHIPSSVIATWLVFKCPCLQPADVWCG